MNRKNIIELFNKFSKLKIAVVGDFFLDKYLVIDTTLNEPSIETALTAYQVTASREFPGASGTVCNNLAALGVGAIYSVGFVGNDGNGYELKRELDKINIKRDYLFETDQMVTPSYVKPMMMQNGVEKESNRQDIKNFKSTDEVVEEKIINCLDEVFELCDAIIILDQMVENGCGVITTKVRKRLIELGSLYSNKVIFADSRARIQLFKDISIKCNNFEVCKAFNSTLEEEPAYSDVLVCGKKLYEENKKPVFVTLGKEGIVTFGEQGIHKIPSADVPRPYDICGAGDSVTAAVVSSLAAGANESDAAFIGNLVAAITIRKIGITGTANIKEVLETFDDYFYNIKYSKETL